MKKYYPYITGTILAAFALLTLFLSTAVIFDLFDMRAKEGNYVLFIVWSNFICSILYLISAYGIFKLKQWPHKLLFTAGLVLIIAFLGLLIHIYTGGLYEIKTIKAMLFRISITFIFAKIAKILISKKK